MLVCMCIKQLYSEVCTSLFTEKANCVSCHTQLFSFELNMFNVMCKNIKVVIVKVCLIKWCSCKVLKLNTALWSVVYLTLRYRGSFHLLWVTWQIERHEVDIWLYYRCAEVPGGSVARTSVSVTWNALSMIWTSWVWSWTPVGFTLRCLKLLSKSYLNPKYKTTDQVCNAMMFEPEWGWCWGALLSRVILEPQIYMTKPLPSVQRSAVHFLLGGQWNWVLAFDRLTADKNVRYDNH